MPSTRRQIAKARKSREMDMMSDMEYLDVMLGNGSVNPIERELVDVIEQSSVQGDSNLTCTKGVIIGILLMKMVHLDKMKRFLLLYLLTICLHRKEKDQAGTFLN